MKGFWKKNVLAALLALTMIVTLLPAAAAGEGDPPTTDPTTVLTEPSTTEPSTTEPTEPPHSHSYPDNWTPDPSDDTRHVRACECGVEESERHSLVTVTTKEPSCYEEGEKVSTCSVCGFEKKESIATTPHSYGSDWSFNNEQHWRTCQNEGCTATGEIAAHTKKTGTEKTVKAATCTEKGRASYTCSICGTVFEVDVDALGHTAPDANGKCTRCGQVVAEAQNLTVTFKTGSGTTTQSVKKGAKPTKPSTPSMTAAGKTYTFKGWTTSSTSTYVYTGQSLTTVESTAVNANVTYYALYTVKATGQNVSVELDDASGITANTATSENSSLRSQMNSKFSSITGADMTKVKFGSESGATYGKLYSDDSKTSLSTSKYYYYSSSSYGNYPLSYVYFLPSGNKGTYSIAYILSDENGNSVEGKASFVVGSVTSKKITYSVSPGDEVSFKRSDFNDVYQASHSETIRWVTFSTSSTLNESNGTVYYDYGGKNEKAFTKSTIDDYNYYYSNSSYGDYELSELSFAAGEDASSHTVTLSFRAYYSSSKYVDGTVEIKVGKGAASGKINYTVSPGDQVDFDRSDFNDAYQNTYTETVRWVTFSTSSTLNESNGTVYYNYDGKNEKAFTKSTIDDYKFYYNSDSYGDYELSKLSFVAGKDFDSTVTLSFRAYYSSSKYVDGTVTLEPKESDVTYKGDIVYRVNSGNNLQLNPNDFARFFDDRYPSSTFQSVELKGVPSTGNLYYNYYGASKYGPSKLRLTSSNYDDYTFRFSPTTTSQYALSELTYIPSGVNYCVTVPFTAYGSGSRSVSGTILINVTRSTLSEVYAVTTKGSSITLPDSDIYSAVASATSATLGSVQLLALPASSAGTVYVGSGTGTKATTTTRYSYSSGSQRIGQLRFAPASGFTGSVELPYVAYDKDGDAIASGKIALGVVGSVRKYSDVYQSSWFYKYVVELSDANVVNGYKDSSFRPDGQVTYGEALKLIMLASGYSAQAQTDSHWASGYLLRAQSDGLVSGNINLDAPINRLAVTQIAAKALRLDTSDVPSVNPFSDTDDAYVQALYAAGIVEGYFSNGVTTFRPRNTLTRAEIATIVWRMERMD